ALALPLASLAWVMAIKFFLGGHITDNGVAPGIYPKWSRMHLRVWCIGRLEASVIRPLDTMFRSAPLMTFVLRRLGATIGGNVNCAHDVEFKGPLDLLTIADDVTVQTGAYIHMSRWLGQELHIGPVDLENGCKIGMRAGIANNVRVGQGTWITPLTPILGDVGPHEMWEGAPARFSSRITALKRPLTRCRYAYPHWCLESFNILLQVFLDFWLLVVPTAAVAWFAATFIPINDSELAGEYFTVTPLQEVVWQMGLYSFITTWVTIVLVSVVSCLFLRYTPASHGLLPSRGHRAYL
ncbi:unnamed protein product, partial [marine sediment metagenome]